MPRLSVKRSCFSFILVAVTFLVYFCWRERHLPSRRDYQQSKVNKENSSAKPWFLDNGTVRPIAEYVCKRKANLWPEESPGDDRITEQLMFVPRDKPRRLKIVVTDYYVHNGRELFKGCPVDACTVYRFRANASETVDAFILKDSFHGLKRAHNTSSQIWILHMLECPFHTLSLRYPSIINWTATYRRDSDIVTPYGKWIYYNHSIKQLETPLRNFAANKTKKVAMFVSNCVAQNNRLDYAAQLKKYINVDIYGLCGTHRCSRSNQSFCFQMLRKHYKFYLAFENANCRDYITEKFFINALENDVLPIVMGARPQDYELVAPMKSYIHVDDFESPKQLAEYLHKLDADDNLYNEYFRWQGTGEFINTHFYCRICALLHDDYPLNKSYSDVNEWWRNEKQCSDGRWPRPTQSTLENRVSIPNAWRSTNVNVFATKMEHSTSKSFWFVFKNKILSLIF